jgi:membrane protease YdiL (CAAX protease family)
MTEGGPARRRRSLPVQALLLYAAVLLAVRLASLRSAPLQPEIVGAALFLYAPLLHYRGGRRPAWIALRDAGTSLRVLLAAAAAAVFAFYLYTRLPLPPVPGFVPGHLPPLGEFLFRQAVLVALPEEVFFRGYLYDAFEEKGWEPILPSSALFCAGHLAIHATPYRALTFFPALLLGWSRKRTGSIHVPVLLHFLFNMLPYLRELPG